jgi:hypothetical protein
MKEIIPLAHVPNVFLQLRQKCPIKEKHLKLLEEGRI